MISAHDGGARSVRTTRAAVLTFGFFAVVVTACVWAGLSFAEVINVVAGS